MTLDARVDRARRLLAGVEKNHSAAVLASSFGAEDMVVLDLIARDGLAIGVFTLDTGRLPRETHALVAEVRRRYGLEIEIFSPWPDSVAAYVEQHGIDGFYDGVESRKACCAVRKVEPLRRALAGKRGWVTGLRREQAETRTTLAEAEPDAAYGLWKFNPLADWTADEVWEYLRSNRVPYNALHDRGYPSIGCEPCTRAVKPGEHPRAGRWWWEQQGARKECGLHEIPIRVLEVERPAA
jgi:phosphoadenosine phosphosulfate reductase